ncbi:MAG TPA: Rieske 2Fe-2S domain-containing protein [Myxococcales bacterium]|jgi:nitrite reductase/ring-hydroxylating ferredoxin subunit|nr:Rieske 2Fe-2S domain-containing protein [Myxococcales bacterium]
MAPRDALGLDELWVGEMRGLHLGGRRVLVVRLGEGVRAYEDRCPHLGVPLSEGTLDGATLTCRAHAFTYDAVTGQGKNPRLLCLRPFPVTVDGGRVRVDVEAGAGAGAEATR